MLNKSLMRHLQNPLTKERDQLDTARVIKSFPTLGAGPEQYSLVLRRYLDNRPETFFDKDAYDIYLCWFEKQNQNRPNQLKGYLAQFDSEINRALLFLRELNLERWHDGPLSNGDDYDLIRMIDKHIHPAYQRLVEGVLAPFLRPLAYFFRLDRSKRVDGLDVWNITEELRGQREERLIRHYQHMIRNGIAHGGISYLQQQIRYRDKKGNEDTFDATFVIRLFDDLLDTCNGLAAAIKVFFIVSRSRGYVPPGELMIEALQELTWAPWWTIEGCVEAEIAGRSQLTVYAKPDSRDYRKVFWSTVQSGILSESLASGYDRYYFSLRSRKALPGWAAFDGHRLKDLREGGNDSLSAFKGILEGNVVFYIPKLAVPAALARIDTLAMSVRINIPIAIGKIKDSLGTPLMFCRTAALHRNSWGAVVRGSVVVVGLDNEEIVCFIRKNCGRIVKSAKKHARKEGIFNFVGSLPIGYAQVAVFRKDYRQRRLSGFGLSEDLVCTVRLQRIRRIKSPDILGSTVETMGKWRIAWNKAWLDSVGKEVLDR